MKRAYILVVFLGVLNTVFSQENCGIDSKFKIESKTIIGSKRQLPFWLWANQLGRYDQNEDLSQNFELLYKDNCALQNGLIYCYGGRLNTYINSDNDFDLSELYGGLTFKKIYLKVGKWNEIELVNGLSTSNKNLVNSRNARPHPRIRIGLNDFVGKGFRIKGFWEEGLLNDNRYVEDTRLHRKAFYFRVGKIRKLEFTAGIEHLVMWGGTSPDYGKFPSSFNDYLKYITFRSGTNDSPKYDQDNTMGNQFGIYNLQLRKEFTKVILNYYMSHPFEDRSGVELDNYKDNLFGFHLKSKRRNAWIQNIIFEYTYSKNQSGSHHSFEGDQHTKGRGKDNYFNNYAYRSGFTYHGMMMSSPLFGLIQYNEDGIPIQITNNLISAWHLGMNGYLNKQLKWELKLTHSKNGGTMDVYYPSNRSQFSSLLGFSYQCPKLPMTVKLDMALDKGELWDDGVDKTRFGGAFTIAYTL